MFLYKDLWIIALIILLIVYILGKSKHLIYEGGNIFNSFEISDNVYPIGNWIGLFVEVEQCTFRKILGNVTMTRLKLGMLLVAWSKDRIVEKLPWVFFFVFSCYKYASEGLNCFVMNHFEVYFWLFKTLVTYEWGVGNGASDGGINYIICLRFPVLFS